MTTDSAEPAPRAAGEPTTATFEGIPDAARALLAEAGQPATTMELVAWLRGRGQLPETRRANYVVATRLARDGRFRFDRERRVWSLVEAGDER